MILKETLEKISSEQKKDLESRDFGIKRELLDKIDLEINHVVIVSGVRRCGKSTLIRQLTKNKKAFYYMSFEDQRLLEFNISDFESLKEVFQETFLSNIWFLDEIQNIDGWERFVRKMHDMGTKFIVTGSNASLLSKELGTKLTGRHLTYELFPFSYSEMLALTSQKPSASSLEEYMKNGGFPEFLKYRKIELLQNIFLDILNRDISERYRLREIKTLKQFATYLLTNVGKEFSYTNISKFLNMGSVNTAISFSSYLEGAYLIFTIPKFDYSYRKQLINPKKVYSVDTGLSMANSTSFSQDKGRVLENVVFLGLRRKHKDIYYFRDKGECDFLVKEKENIVEAVQVCYHLTEDNKEREISGLEEVMRKFNLKTGTIVTFDQEDSFGKIKVIPAWKWLIG